MRNRCAASHNECILWIAQSCPRINEILGALHLKCECAAYYICSTSADHGSRGWLETQVTQEHGAKHTYILVAIGRSLQACVHSLATLQVFDFGHHLERTSLTNRNSQAVVRMALAMARNA